VKATILDTHGSKPGFIQKCSRDQQHLSMLFSTGGQRQRLAIARAIYSKAPCTFLDSPFSALDPDLANHVFNVGILKILRKRKRTVLVSISTSILRAAFCTKVFFVAFLYLKFDFVIFW